MTNAERQKRYRDKQRGGPPVGRWAGHVSREVRAVAHDTSRSIIMMSKWILRHAPEYEKAIKKGAIGESRWKRFGEDGAIGLLTAGRSQSLLRFHALLFLQAG